MYKEFLSKGFYVPSHIQFDVGGLLFGAVYDASFTVKTLLLNLNAQFEFRNSELLLIVRWGSMVGYIKLSW